MKMRQWVAIPLLASAIAGLIALLAFSVKYPHLTQMQIFLETWQLKLISVLLIGIASWMLAE